MTSVWLLPLIEDEKLRTCHLQGESCHYRSMCKIGVCRKPCHTLHTWWHWDWSIFSAHQIKELSEIYIPKSIVVCSIDSVIIIIFLPTRRNVLINGKCPPLHVPFLIFSSD